MLPTCRRYLLPLLLLTLLQPVVAAAQSTAGGPSSPNTYSEQAILETGHQFFGTVSGGLASVVETAVSRYGEPNAYILGQEGSGAFVAGLRYGEGDMHTRNQGVHKIFWQGPSVGFDFGADGDRVMMLVYNLPSTNAMMNRYVGVDGSAYLVGGFGMTVLANSGIYVVPVRSGVGARLGINAGYLKFTKRPTWNPF